MSDPDRQKASGSFMAYRRYIDDGLLFSQNQVDN